MAAIKKKLSDSGKISERKKMVYIRYIRVRTTHLHYRYKKNHQSLLYPYRKDNKSTINTTIVRPRCLLLVRYY